MISLRGEKQLIYLFFGLPEILMKKEASLLV